ncbi:MAG: GtrA family protein [Verrucomicrobiota bacterium]
MKELFSRNRQFILYCVIGASGVTLDFLVYSALLKTVALNYQVANAAGYVSGTLLSFFLNAHFNFKTRNWLALRLFSFCAVALLGYAASAGTLYLLVARFGLDKYLSKLATLAVVVALQYNLNRLISFRKSPPAKN